MVTLLLDDEGRCSVSQCPTVAYICIDIDGYTYIHTQKDIYMENPMKTYVRRMKGRKFQ